MIPSEKRNLAKVSHLMRAQNKMLQGMNYYVTKPYKNYRSPQMGSLFSDWTGVDIDINKAINEAMQFTITALCNLPNLIATALSQINWNNITNNLLHLVREGARLIFVEFNPIRIVWSNLKNFPLTGHLARELDKLTGGVISDVENLSTLTGRAIHGDAISEQELIKDAMVGAKIAAVVLSGGSASVIVSQSADTLKSGTLGETETGRALLNVAAAGGYAWAANAAIQDAVEHQIIREACASGKTEVIKHSPLADSKLGLVFINAAFAATESELIESGSGLQSAANVAKQAAAQQSAEAVCKEAGIPCTPEVVKAFREADYPPKIENVDFNAIQAGSGGTLSFDALQRAINNVNIKFEMPSINFDTISDGTIDTDQVGESSSLIKTNEDIDWTQSHVAPVSICGKEVVLPNPGNPEGMAEIIKMWQLIKFLLRKKGKIAKYRRRIKVGDQWYDVYLLEDGSYYWELASSVGYLIAAGLGLMGLFVLLNDD